MVSLPVGSVLQLRFPFFHSSPSLSDEINGKGFIRAILNIIPLSAQDARVADSVRDDDGVGVPVSEGAGIWIS